MAGKVVKDILKSSVVKMVAALAVVGVVAGITLVFVYNYSMPKIRANTSAEMESAIKNIFPEMFSIENAPQKDVFLVRDRKGRLLGYAFLAEGNGYQGVIKLIVGVDPAISSMKGMEVLESQETPGLGAEIAGENFRKQFVGLSLAHPIEYVKNQKPQQPYQIEAITGATISSRAVVNILNERIGQICKLLKDRR